MYEAVASLNKDMRSAILLSTDLSKMNWKIMAVVSAVSIQICRITQILSGAGHFVSTSNAVYLSGVSFHLSHFFSDHIIYCDIGRMQYSTVLSDYTGSSSVVSKSPTMLQPHTIFNLEI